MLSWDAATMMPPGGGAARGDQLAVLAGMRHSLLVADLAWTRTWPKRRRQTRRMHGAPPISA